MPARIGLFLASAPKDGGAYQYSFSMLTAVSELHDLGYESIVVCASQHWLGYVQRHRLSVICTPITAVQHVALKCVKFGLIPLKFWRAVCTRMSPITRVLAEQRCDLWIFPSQDEWAYAAPVNALGTIHDLMHRYESRFPEVSKHGKYRRRELHYRKLCKWARGLLVDSETGKQQLIASYNVHADDVYVLPFVAPNYISAEQKSVDDLDTKYKLPKKFIFYPAQFWQHKNHERLIQALASLTDDISDLALVLIGSPKNNYKAVLDLVKTLGIGECVRFLDYVPNDDIAALYRRARAMIMPTFFGPTNIPPLEAFASGCPAAVSNVYGMPEQVGDAALLFDPNSVDEIAHTIKSLWLDDSLCRALAEKGKRQHARWNQTQFNHRVREIIDAIIARTNLKQSPN